jgi:hypothetical protein
MSRSRRRVDGTSQRTNQRPEDSANKESSDGRLLASRKSQRTEESWRVKGADGQKTQRAEKSTNGRLLASKKFKKKKKFFFFFFLSLSSKPASQISPVRSVHAINQRRAIKGSQLVKRVKQLEGSVRVQSSQFN